MLAAAAGGLAAVAAQKASPAATATAPGRVGDPAATPAARAPVRDPVGHIGWWPWWLGDAWRALDARALSRVVWFDAPVQDDGRVSARDPHAQRHALRAALPPRCRLDVAIAMVTSRSYVIALPVDRREELVARVRALAESVADPATGLVPVPYVTRTYCARRDG